MWRMKPKVLQILPMYHQAGETVLNEGADVVRTDDLDPEHLKQMVQHVEGVVLRAPAKMTADIIRSNPRLKVISGAGAGLDNIDVQCATACAIPVLHAPSVNAVSTAEHALTLMLCLLRQIKLFQEKMHAGDFASRDTIVTNELRGKTVGLIGFGAIAREVAKRCRYGFDANVVAYVRRIPDERQQRAHDLGVRLTTDLMELFSTADIVSVHVPFSPDTRHMIQREHFRAMKRSAFFVNTARGGVVNTEHLIEALKRGTIAGAGIDVFDPEPPPKDLPLLKLSNVVATPHIGGVTEEANRITSTSVARNVLRVLRGEMPEHIANPEVLGKSVKE